ncbi:MAG TPA: zinc ribbon domain-containing protein [Melioribacteraceae bacterium]|nr:zinc ribbon domain-containing protein [Melioribacteraceae bacterium]
MLEYYFPNTISKEGGNYFCQLCYNYQLTKEIEDNEVEIAQIILKKNDLFPECPIHKGETIWEKGVIEYEEPDEETNIFLQPTPPKYEYECSECKKNVKAEDKLCPFCGAKLDEIEEDKTVFFFNVGAAFFHPVWLFAHGQIFSGFFMSILYAVIYTVLDYRDEVFTIIMMIVTVIINIYWGLTGNEIAYEDKKYKNATQFNKNEKVWIPLGISAAISQFTWFYNVIKLIF